MRLFFLVYFIFLMFFGFLCERIFKITIADNGNTQTYFVFFLIEAPLVLLLPRFFYLKNFILPRSFMFLLIYCLLCLLSALLNEQSVIDGLKYCRYTIFAYIVYLAAINNKNLINQRSFYQMFVITFLLQIVASLVYVFILDERLEWRVGTISVWGGELGTVFPLVALGFVMGAYFYFKKNFVLLLLAVSFCIVAFACGKRAIYGLFPFFVLINYLLYIYYGRFKFSSGLTSKQLLHLVNFIIIAIPILIYGMSKSVLIGFDFNEPVEVIIQDVTNNIFSYEFEKRESGKSVGRFSTSSVVYQNSASPSNLNFYFGNGPASLLDNRNILQDLDIDYGVVGATRDILSIGWPGLFFYYIFIYSVYAEFRRSTLIRFKWNSFDKFYTHGIHSNFIVFFISDIYYTAIYRTTPVPIFFLFFLTAVMTRKNLEESHQMSLR